MPQEPRTPRRDALHAASPEAPKPRSGRAFGGVAAALGLALTLPGAAGGTPEVAPAAREPTATEMASPVAALRDDPRVRAIVETYGSRIDSIAYAEDDVVFQVRGHQIHFLDGRMLNGERLDRVDRCDPIFYEYRLAPLTEAIPVEDRPNYCTDWQEGLWGRTEGEIRTHGRSARFLDHSLFVNELLLEPLAEVEQSVLAAALDDASVRQWIDELDIIYSFVDRKIAGTKTRSQHAYGLALDLVPHSYGRKAVYWRWSRALDREGWSRIPPSRRWSPPQRVIEIFESRGFVWGGKWGYFDNMHFEYRPEILLFNRLAAG
jgi:hypothetical protein